MSEIELVGEIGISLEMCSFVLVAGTMMAVVPTAGDISWLPTFNATSATGAVGSIAGTVPPVVTALAMLAALPPSLMTSASMGMEVPMGTYVGKGVLPVPERLAKKIQNLEFVEMRELMPETWLMEEEERSRPTSCRKNAYITVAAVLCRNGGGAITALPSNSTGADGIPNNDH